MVTARADFFLPLLLVDAYTRPLVQKKYGGTVGISSAGMFGKGGGWGIPLAYRALDVTLGGIAEKPGVVDGQIAIREYLCMTLSMDHDIIDGAPAARLIMRLKELIESGFALIEQEDMVEKVLPEQLEEKVHSCGEMAPV